jgi:hypothetical protein
MIFKDNNDIKDDIDNVIIGMVVILFGVLVILMIVSCL